VKKLKETNKNAEVTMGYTREKQDASTGKKSRVLGSGSPGPSGKMNKAMLLLCVLGLIRIIPPPPHLTDQGNKI
jgi:hypothetical protein